MLLWKSHQLKNFFYPEFPNDRYHYDNGLQNAVILSPAVFKFADLIEAPRLISKLLPQC